MDRDDRKPFAPAEETLPPAEPAALTAEPPALPAETRAAPTDVLAPIPAAPPLLVEPEALVEGLRYLQQRIPGFTQLSMQEKRSAVRVANLDPEFIENGLQAASVWPDTKLVVRRTGEELLQEREEILRWDRTLVELRALTAGIEAANLKRKHRLGAAILQIYGTLDGMVNRGSRRDSHMRPYYENMKRAFLRTQKFSKKKKQKE